MSEFEIHNRAKQELEEIINDLFFDKIDFKLDEKVKALSTKIDEKSNGITKNIGDVIQASKSSKELVEELKDESERRDVELIKKVEENSESLKAINVYISKNNEEVVSIHNKLSEIQDKNLGDILKSAIRIIENQKFNSENLLLRLDGIIVLQGESLEKIKLDNSENLKLVETILTELRSSILAIINENDQNQNNNLHDLDKSISDFIFLGKQNNENLVDKLDEKFQSIEEVKIANNETLKSVLNKNNSLFISVLIINVLIMALLLLNYFFK